MTNHSSTKKLLIEHYKKYPKLQIQDLFKFLFQSSFGCEHMISSLDFVTNYIIKEASTIEQKNIHLVEQLDGSYSRVHLSYLKKWLSPYTLGKLFYLSAKKEVNGLKDLKEKIIAAKELIQDGLLPFSADDFNTAIDEWSKKGYPAINHSNIFRNEYGPSYRVIADKYIPFLPLFSDIDKILEKKSATLIVENDITKQTDVLIETILEIYDCNIVSLDDCQIHKLKKDNQKIINYPLKFKCSLIDTESTDNKTRTLTIIKYLK
jgi:hypothetical protein